MLTGEDLGMEEKDQKYFSVTYLKKNNLCMNGTAASGMKDTKPHPNDLAVEMG